MIDYRLPRRSLVGFGVSVLLLRPRSFAGDAQAALVELGPALEVRGAEHVPVTGPVLVACNHYGRPGFPTGWLAFAVSGTVATRRAPGADREIHWVMTAAWTFPESRWRRRLLTPLTRWAFRRVARVYGFIPMPPMPPAPHEVAARARAVLETVRLARELGRTGGMIGLAPEGRDAAVGLAEPPEGVGRFLALLVEAGLPVLPVGVWESARRLHVAYGPVFVPEVPAERARQDRAVAGEVMDAIARQIPVS